MNEDEVLAVTAYILRLNQIDPGPNLTAQKAKQIRLRYPQPQIGPTQAITASPSEISKPLDEACPVRNSPSVSCLLRILDWTTLEILILSGYFYLRSLMK